MSESSVGLRTKIATAADLQAMARTMKTVAASNIGQYQHAVAALAQYDDAVQWTLAVCLRNLPSAAPGPTVPDGPVGAVIFGSDQGLAGQFNETICAYALDVKTAPAGLSVVWPVGERIAQCLAGSPLDSRRVLGTQLRLPTAVDAIAALVGQLVVEIEASRARGEIEQVYVFHHRPDVGVLYQPAMQRLLPLDDAWVRALLRKVWPRRTVPQALPGEESMLTAAVQEYLFVSLYRACAESLASENTARLAAMQRAERNIGELQQQLKQTFHRQRQGAIDAELFDLVSGFETLGAP